MFSTPTVKQSGASLHVEHGTDSNLYVEFRMESVHQAHQSDKEGRPIFRDVPYVRIITPGDKTKVRDTIATDEHKVRFPRQWEAFSNQQVQVSEGTPITEWPPLTRSEAMEFKALNIHTVEQLAGLPDVALNWLGGMERRKQAQAYLAASKDTAMVTKMDKELAKRDADNMALKNQLAELTARFSEMEDDQPKKRGRPAKIEE